MGGACVDTGAMARWLESRGEGRESSESRAALEDHLETCAECRALVIELARETDGGTARSARSGERPAEAPPLEVGSRVGRYLVVDWLGAGGMGVVYRAYDPELHRQVALKVLRATAPAQADGDSRDRMRARLVDEARAAARVTHPNVITVHDAGTHEGQVYLAMELVSGQTLAQWVGGVAGRVGIAAAAPVAEAATEATRATSAASPIRAERRTPEAVLARFVAAGRGLAAIHAAGLVHGDFKPQNVLLGDDGRVCVGDFGLARERTERPIADGDAAADVLRSDDRDRAGVVLGTPRYMAPELLAGHPADAASDQYAFCVALREALDARVPATARRVLARGLSPHPADRFATMDALLAVLVPRRRLVALRTALVLALLACVVGGGLSLSYVRRPPRPSPCAGAEQWLAGVWDEPRRAAVAAAFASSTAPFAADVGREVMARLDAYAREWTAMSTDSCAATRIRAVQSEELFDLRAACLADRARNLGALGDELLTANAEEQQKAVAAAVALPPLNECADAVSLRAKVRPPSDPTARAEAERVEHDLARAQTMLHLGAYRAGKDLARSLLPRAVSTGDRALEARVHLLHGQTAMSLGLDADADDALYEAAGAAEAAEDQTTKAAAWTVLTEVLANHQARYPEAERAGKLALATLSRLPQEAELHAQLDDALSNIDSGQGRLKEALARAQQGLALRLSAFGPDDPRVGVSFTRCGGIADDLGDEPLAIDYLQRAVALYHRVLGARHPRLAVALYDLARAEGAAHRFAAAEVDMKECYEVWMATAGPEHTWTYLYEAQLADALSEAGHAGEALAHAERAVTLADRASTEPDRAIDARNELALVYRRLGRHDAALATLREAAARLDALANPPHQAAWTYLIFGQTYLSLGRAHAAVTSLERALTLHQAATSTELDIAETKLTLARALHESGENPARAATLEQEAREVYARHPEAASDLDELTTRK